MYCVVLFMRKNGEMKVTDIMDLLNCVSFASPIIMINASCASFITNNIRPLQVLMFIPPVIHVETRDTAIKDTCYCVYFGEFSFHLELPRRVSGWLEPCRNYSVILHDGPRGS